MPEKIKMKTCQISYVFYFKSLNSRLTVQYSIVILLFLYITVHCSLGCIVHFTVLSTTLSYTFLSSLLYIYVLW